MREKKIKSCHQCKTWEQATAISQSRNTSYQHNSMHQTAGQEQEKLGNAYSGLAHTGYRN